MRRPLTAEVVERLNEHSQITHLLWAAETDTREEDFDHLRQLRHVHSVGLRGSEHSRESLAKLVEMPSLRHLTLFSGDLDQGDVQELAKSSSLREIHVNPEASMMPGATTTRPPSSSVQISPQSLQLP